MTKHLVVVFLMAFIASMIYRLYVGAVEVTAKQAGVEA